MTVIYTKNACGGCTATKLYIKNNGLVEGEDYIIKNVEEDEQAYADALATGLMQMPIVVTDDDAWSGFRPDKLLSLAK